MTRFWRQPICLAPRPLRPWLTARGSLTTRLRARFAGLRLTVLKQNEQAAHNDEWQALLLPRRETRVATREVLLLDGATPLVFAHSVAQRGSSNLLDRAGPHPLGALLFADRTIRRAPLTWRRIDSRHPLWRQARAAAGPLPTQLWARRSLFHSGRNRLLVTEVFLPAIIPPC